MRCVCGDDGTDQSDELHDLILRFLREGGNGMVMGIRRMGRDQMVDFVYDLALSNGIDISIYPDTSGSIVLLRNWIDSDGSDIPPGKDVVYGQDMCHQYPAIGRMERDDPRM